MSAIEVNQGVVLGFGGTNARKGTSYEGDITGFTSVSTPERPREFFGWMARQVLDAADQGNSWLVAGFPGPVSLDRAVVGPLVNVPGLSKKRYNLTEELAAADPAASRLFNEGFDLVAVNDGVLAALAAAGRIGEHKYNRTAALILGTGVGAGIVTKDPAYENVFRAVRDDPVEIGHAPQSADPFDTFENAVSGTALECRYGIDPREMPADHPAWRRVAETAGRMAALLGLMHGAELVVPTGGIGAGASDKYELHLAAIMDIYKTHGNGTQQLFLPEIRLVPPAEVQVFEMYGGEGVMRDFRTQNQAA